MWIIVDRALNFTQTNNRMNMYNQRLSVYSLSNYSQTRHVHIPDDTRVRVKLPNTSSLNFNKLHIKKILHQVLRDLNFHCRRNVCDRAKIFESQTTSCHTLSCLNMHEHDTCACTQHEHERITRKTYVFIAYQHGQCTYHMKCDAIVMPWALSLLYVKKNYLF